MEFQAWTAALDVCGHSLSVQMAHPQQYATASLIEPNLVCARLLLWKKQFVGGMLQSVYSDKLTHTYIYIYVDVFTYIYMQLVTQIKLGHHIINH